MKHILSNSWHEIIRFDEGEEILGELTKFVKERRIGAGWFFALGSASSVELSYYDAKKKEYIGKNFNEFLEIIAANGNIAWKDGEPIFHIHGSFGRTDYTTVSGHIYKLTAAATVEVFIHKIEGELNRTYDEKTGLNLFV